MTNGKMVEDVPSEGIFRKLLTRLVVYQKCWDVFCHFCPMGICLMGISWHQTPMKKANTTDSFAFVRTKSTCGDFLCMLILRFISPGKKVVGLTYHIPMILFRPMSRRMNSQSLAGWIPKLKSSTFAAGAWFFSNWDLSFGSVVHSIINPNFIKHSLYKPSNIGALEVSRLKFATWSTHLWKPPFSGGPSNRLPPLEPSRLDLGPGSTDIERWSGFWWVPSGND